MAKAQAAAEAAEHEYKGGEIVSFLKYEEDLGDQDPLLNEGDRMKVSEVKPDGGLVCVIVDDKNKPITGRQGDTVFPEEVSLLDADPPAEQARKPRTRTTGKKKPAAKSKTAAKAKPETKAKAKGKKDSQPVAKGKTDEKTEDETPVVINHDSAVAALINEMGALEAAETLVEQTEQSYFHLGGVLMEVREKGLHEQKGYTGAKGFHDYVEMTLGMKEGKARNLINIYSVFRDPRIVRKLTPKRLKELGWAKAKQLSRLGVEQLLEHWDDVFGYAMKHSRNELIEHVKETYVVATTEGQEKVKKTKFTFSLIGDAAKSVNRALDEAKSLVGEDDLNKAFEYICGEWLAMSVDTETAGETNEDEAAE